MWRALGELFDSILKWFGWVLIGFGGTCLVALWLCIKITSGMYHLGYDSGVMNADKECVKSIEKIKNENAVTVVRLTTERDKYASERQAMSILVERILTDAKSRAAVVELANTEAKHGQRILSFASDGSIVVSCLSSNTPRGANWELHVPVKYSASGEILKVELPLVVETNACTTTP